MILCRVGPELDWNPACTTPGHSLLNCKVGEAPINCIVLSGRKYFHHYVQRYNKYDSGVSTYHDSGTGKAYGSSREVDGSFAYVVEFLVTDDLEPLLECLLPGVQLQHLWTFNVSIGVRH